MAIRDYRGSGPGRLKVKIGKLELDNPVILASGTCGFVKEIEEFVKVDKIGAIVTKTITYRKREGNPPPRVAEASCGLLNSIGLDNRGLKDFMFEKVPYLERLKVPVIVSIAANSVNEFIRLTRELSRVGCIGAIEVNLSCPNVIHRGTRFPVLAQDRKAVERIMLRLRKVTSCVLIAKLSPHVIDIKDIARAAEGAGCNALSLVNTYPGMLVDVHTMRPKLGGISGGLSGPCIKPLALKCVWDAYSAVSIPIIGMGGIMNAEDAIEFILCGATAVQIGTANFVNPGAPLEIIRGIDGYLKDKGIKSVKSLTGKIRV